MFLVDSQGPGILEGAPEILEEVPVVYEGSLGVHYVVSGVHEGFQQCLRRFQWLTRGYGFIRRFHPRFMVVFQIFLGGFKVFMVGYSAADCFCPQVATNGIVSAQDLPMEKQYVDDGFPTDFPVVAPFLADIDTSGGRGQIYYRVTETPSVLNRVAQVCSPTATRITISLIIDRIQTFVWKSLKWRV